MYRAHEYGQAYVDEGLQAYEERFKAACLRTCEQIAKQLQVVASRRTGRMNHVLSRESDL